MKSDYLRDMLEQDYLSDHELQRRTALLGINASLPIVVLIASFDSDIAPQIHFKIEALVKQYDSQAALISRTNEIVIFLHSANGPKVPVLQATRLGQSTVSMAQSEGCTCRVGVGRSYEGVRKLKESYAEAKRALSVAASMGKSVLAFSEMGLHRLLSFIPDDVELVAFCQDVLGDLIEYDTQHGASLMETLSCYLSLGCKGGIPLTPVTPTCSGVVWRTTPELCGSWNSVSPRNRPAVTIWRSCGGHRALFVPRVGRESPG
jgi:sugar diacid utilization regulator